MHSYRPYSITMQVHIDMILLTKINDYKNWEHVMQKLLGVFLLSIVLLGCSQGNVETTKIDIIESFAASGISGKEQEKMYAMIGAIDGFGIKGDNFSVELYKFKTPELAENCAICEHTNKNWGMLMHKKADYPEEVQNRIVSVFGDL